MQYAYAELLNSVHDENSYALKPVTKPAEDAEDSRRSRRRAESHPRFVLYKLHAVLAQKRDACSTALARGTVEDAMRPMQVRMDRYAARARREQERREDRERRREEREFRIMMANWVQGTNVDVVESQLEEICAWQVRRLMMDDRCCLAAADLENSPPWSDRLLFQFIIR